MAGCVHYVHEEAEVLIYLDLGLSRVVAELDSQGAEILENQKETLAERKRLAELTKGKFLCIYCFQVFKRFDRIQALVG